LQEEAWRGEEELKRDEPIEYKRLPDKGFQMKSRVRLKTTVSSGTPSFRKIPLSE